jgi:exopolysaccharide biosynthesis polyprenyl glycosylphosphotransferase
VAVVGHDSVSWLPGYVRLTVGIDCCCALAAGLLAFNLRFANHHHASAVYFALSLSLPVIWLIIVALSGGYDPRFVGLGSDEFRKVINAGVGLIAAVAIVSYATRADIARGYVVVALPCTIVFDLFARYALRKWLHRLRSRGICLRRVVVVGHARVVASLTEELRRETHHGFSVVAACLAQSADSPEPPIGAEIAGVPAVVGLDTAADVAERMGADTVAVLSCPEISGAQLRALAWELEKTGTDLCLAPALLDVAGPRTTIRPVAGLMLLHVDHPEFTGARRVIKAVFDRAFASIVLLLTAPLLLLATLGIWLADGGPALFRQTRVGKDGKVFTVYKFRTMVLDAEERKAELAMQNEHDGLMFKIRSDPRITNVGRWLRRWSVDELPQLVNVLLGDMSLVGPRPALPEEADRYADHVRRRLMVKPGLTGLWQVNGRADLTWDESVRLDLRYVENWSFVLDLQILWKTVSAVLSGSGAY